jgi:peptide/nickel transport system permease protein
MVMLQRLLAAPYRVPVLAVVVRRLVLSVPLLFVVSVLTFLLTSIVPGDAVHKILGDYAPPEKYKILRHELGLDLPLYQQYWHWLSGAVQGDFGNSLITREPVFNTLLTRLPITLSLVAGTLIVSLVFGVALGVASAVRGGRLGRSVDAFAMAGWVLPGFWLAAQLVIVFAVNLRWFPATGYVPFAQSPGEWLRSIVLPVVALSLGAIGGLAKLTRGAMADALSSEYIRMARANGLPRRLIIMQHAFKTASMTVVTLGSLLIIGFLAGTVFAEQVFALPGLGSMIVDGTNQRDIPVVIGVSVFFTLIVVVINLLTDIVYSLINPKVRTS